MQMVLFIEQLDELLLVVVRHGDRVDPEGLDMTAERQEIVDQLEVDGEHFFLDIQNFQTFKSQTWEKLLSLVSVVAVSHR